MSRDFSNLICPDCYEANLSHGERMTIWEHICGYEYNPEDGCHPLVCEECGEPLTDWGEYFEITYK